MAQPTVKLTYAETKTSFPIIAETLGEVLEALQNRSEPEWGRCTWKMDMDYSGKNGAIKSITLTTSTRIELPTWTGYKNAPQECQDEWNRMLRVLTEHEFQHRSILKIHSAEFKQQLESNPPASADDLEKRTTAWLKEQDNRQKKYDKDSKNGQNEGVYLEISPACK
jgi:predicted secreted Zn-dependent protease